MCVCVRERERERGERGLLKHLIIVVSKSEM